MADELDGPIRGRRRQSNQSEADEAGQAKRVLNAMVM